MAKTILAMLPSEYLYILKSIYRYFHQQENYEIYMLVNSLGQGNFNDCVTRPEQFILLPNWYQHQKWEEDPIEVKRIRDIVRACEALVGIPMHRIILSRERDFGRGYRQGKYYWEERSISYASIKDNELPERIVLRGFKYALDTINRVQPEFIIGGLIGGLNGIFYFLANYLDIPLVSCVFSMFLPKRHAYVSTWGSVPDKPERLYMEKCKNGVKASQKSLDLIHNFRQKPAILPIYADMWKIKITASSLLKTNKAVLNRLMYRIIPLIKRKPLKDPKPFWQFVVNAYRSYILIKKQKKYYISYNENQLIKTQYLYYPMHMEPEHVLNIRSSSWFDQLSTIRLLSSNLPVGYKLLVKEHRFNYGRRPTRYITQLMGLPNVVLIDPFDDQFKYLKHADLVVTVNGTSGFEGLMLKRPVLTLSETFYDCLELAYRLKNIDHIGQVILTALNNHRISDSYDNCLGLLLDAEYESTQADDGAIEDEVSAIRALLHKNNHFADVME